ncbi:MAG: GNAT family N-acetyltransferase [Nitrospira sp.]|nr:MAG: GNAT family N-acetyltransferase [Nitrospira sp.]
MSTSFKVLTADTDQGEIWDAVVAGIDRCDVYFHRSLCQAFAAYEGCVARLAHFRHGDSVIVYPFFQRRIASLPFLQSPQDWNDYSDIVSPYGYGGPLAQIAADSEEESGRIWPEFLEAFHAYCLDHNIVSEFARLHPYLQNHRHLDLSNGLERRSTIVTVDLSQSEEEIWRGFTKENRKKIGRAQANGLRVEEANSPADVQLFSRLYHLNMQRLQARDWYMFPESWLSDLHARFSEHLTLFLVFEGDRVIAGGSMFHMNGLVSNFLSATAEDPGQCSPNNLLFYEIIRWAKRRGYRWYNMGGGYRTNDGVMRFKQNFSQHTEDFYTYQKVHLPQAYEALVQEWRQALPSTIELEESKYFPLYRMIPQ